ncbi:glycosyl transferase family 2 [Fibrobacter succinogenes subsp. succinogenes S85]|nr:glycosyltransferase family 2 protein [Fibrobacter succinogenes]ACX76242.1 glycosyl transferase family 2 [Fibrobacter succinogenes subsp. succinogenes S85]
MRTQEEIMKKWPTNWTTPMVSVRCITYNQESYIAKALDGFLMQETDFPFEVIVHDDASTDRTADIIREYVAKFPKIIKPIYETENQYSKRDGSIARIMLPFLRGKYVAFCEGDDYWCDANKLQLQYEAMEQHPECSICLHKVQVIYENGEKTKRIMPAGKKFKTGFITQDEYAYCIISQADVYFHLSSYFTKTDFLIRIQRNKPDYYKYSTAGDAKLQRFCLNEGKPFFIDRIMSCYRTQSRGSWTLREHSTKEQRKKHMENMIKLDDSFDNYSNYRFHNFIEYGKKYRFYRYLDRFSQYKELLKKENKEKLPPIPIARKIYYRILSVFPWVRNVVIFLRKYV